MAVRWGVKPSQLPKPPQIKHPDRGGGTGRKKPTNNATAVAAFFGKT